MTQTEALKLALEALKEEVRMADGWQSPAEAKAITAIKEALAQPEQEPVKLVSYNCKCGRTMNFESVHGVVAPQRKPLTDEEIAEMWLEILGSTPPSGIHEDGLQPWRFARAIEAAHGIKE